MDAQLKSDQRQVRMTNIRLSLTKLPIFKKTTQQLELRMEEAARRTGGNGKEGEGNDEGQ
jgi:butyrate kinase